MQERLFLILLLAAASALALFCLSRSLRRHRLKRRTRAWILVGGAVVILGGLAAFDTLSMIGGRSTVLGRPIHHR